MNRFVGGVSAAFRGLRSAAENPDVRRAYLQLMFAIFAVTLVIDVAGVWAVVHYTGGAEGDSWYAMSAWILLRIAGIAIVLVAAPVLAVFLANLTFPIMAERVFLAGLRAIDPARALELAGRPGLPLASSIGNSLIRILQFVGLTVLAFLLSLIPIVGAVLGPLLQVWVTARTLAWELLEPYFDKLGLEFDDQQDFMRTHSGPILGFGLPYSFVLAIPLLGPLVFGLAQAAVAELVVNVLEPARRRGSL